MLRHILGSLFGERLLPKEPFHDPLLGKLVPGELGWTVSLEAQGHSFRFTIGGKNEPAVALLAHACDIVNDIKAFERSVKACINSESSDYPEEVKAELAELEIDNVALFWPDRPNDGMIFFRGAERDIGLWRWDYIGHTPRGLGCDT